ncbi:MAG: helix-turn-helix transcriptional regulator [Clostridia bacterium]|nr:helix-turn-helix transcriptional regulator [Clostridia bacterium]
MILADKIIFLRKKQGWSQEELAEQLEVSRQSVSKWEGGLSIPDLNKIVAMSTLFGVSTDYLLKDDLEIATPSETDEQDNAPLRTVSAEEANEYLATVKRISLRIALGVMLCILSPVGLLTAGGLASAGALGLRAGTVYGLGLGLLIALVAVAVAIFVPNGLALSPYAYLDEPFTLSYGVKGIVEKKKSEYAYRYRCLLTVGIVLCILSVVPLLLLGMMNVPEEWLIGATGGILVFCSVGVFLIVRACYVQGSFDRLLQVGEFSQSQKKNAKKNETINSIYWSAITALYLLVSFLTSAWHITWIVWPVAACLDPLFLYLVGLLRK